MSRTTYVDRETHSRWRLCLSGVLLALAVLPAFASAQTVAEKYQGARNRSSKFNLSAEATTVLRVNQYQCGLANDGGSCLDTFGSPTGGGSFWPTGSPNQYMFRSGIQVLGIVPKGADCNLTGPARETRVEPECFAWSGDTTAALFNEGTGSRLHGTPISNIYDSLNPDDLENWPTQGTFPEFPFATAMVEDTSLFNEVLIGRKAASQQDTWVLYWDGDPARTGGRVHPLGVLVEQRTLAWNYPEGNEATIYMIYKVTNVTNSPLFQRLNEDRFFGGANKLPDEGWRLDSLYMAYDSDPDVTHDFQLNYATAIFPFNLGFSYDGSFYEPSNVYPPELFHAPFFNDAPGLVAIKYLQSPTDPATGQEVGLTSFSLHTNGGAFPDPATVQRAWRYVSLNVDPSKGDPNCTFPLNEIKDRRSCYLAQTTSDVRFWVGSGPFSLNPGESATIAVAQYAAATVATPLITRGPDERNAPGLPTLAPGCGSEPIRPIEVAAGYIGPKPGACDASEDGTLSQFDIDVVKNSLLGRALVAQSIYDNKFLLGFAPETPPFYLVPGDNQITVVWEPSATETEGDPFFAAAGDPSNPLYDPNYREHDVEGYRIYRGTSPGDMKLVAQFDKTGTIFTDNLCVTEPDFVPGDVCDRVHEIDISGEFVQFTNIARLESGDPIVLGADTALSAQIAAGTSLPLSNTGIPFAFVDQGVRNGFQYFYRVTAFDINSIRSGPSSLESAGPSRSAIPRASSPNLAMAQFKSYFAGEDGQPLDPSAPLPSIDPATGIFSGKMPPTNALEASFAPLVERLLPQLFLTIQIDSILPFYGEANCPNGFPPQFNNCWKMYLTVNKDGQVQQLVQDGFTPVWAPFGGPNTTEYTLGSANVTADPTSSSQFGIPAGAASFNATLVGEFTENLAMSNHLGQLINRGGNNSGASRLSPIPTNTTLWPGGSRWFTGPNESEPHPGRLDRVGHIPGVDSIFSPQSPGPLATGTNNACWGYNASMLARAADVEFRWNGTGASVFDVTHNVSVPFKPSTQASYGFLTTDANGNGVIDYDDFHYIEGMFNAGTGCARVGGATPVQLVQTPTLVPVSTGRTAIGTLTQTGVGFGIYVNGERYIVQTETVPTSGVWTHRSYQGFVTASSGGDTETPSGYAFTNRNLVRPPMIPGLRAVYEVTSPTVLTDAVDLKKVHTVPDPYYATSLFDLGPSTKELQFVNLPPQATIRIYSLSGILVDVINHDDQSGGGTAKWDLRNRSNQFVASGVYLFHVSTPSGESAIGKFTVVNAGFAR